MMRSISIRLAVAFGLVALVVFSLSGIALYQALAVTLDRQQEADLRDKLDVVEKLAGEIRTLERWDELRKTLATITSTDGNTRFWIACENTDLSYGETYPDHPPGSKEIRTLRLEDDRYPMKTVGKTLRPMHEFPEVHLLVGVSSAPAAHTLQNFALALVLISLCGIALVALVGYRIARFGLRPLADLSAGAQALNPRQPSQRLSLSPAVRELEPLVESFNGALARLEGAYAQLEGFSADVAHELRTPIGNMIGMTQVALTRERSRDELRETLESNLEELERLRAIVNDMLFLARADRGEKAGPLEQVALAQEVAKTIDFFEPLLEEKSLSIEVRGEVEAPVEKSLFRRALSNLLQNAIQHAPAGARLVVELRREPEHVAVAVANPGDTIPAEHLPRLFDRFYRVDAARASSTDSHGLGLAIVHAIARMHGGGVFAESAGGINRIGLTLLPACPG
ncbi:MAG TPA: heavy metal sensor histidine kinase [Noviherbaspirillum sp.]|nr:heavy metal sensor histidine kinase [Noviherbaspirillum sp.]